MADDEGHDENWGNSIARKTFLWTVITAVGFVASVFIFILSRTP
jgi:hypothetical protein